MGQRQERAKRTRVGLLVGSDRQERLVSTAEARSITSLNFGGNTDVYKLIAPDVDFHWLHVIPKYFRQRYRHDLGGCDAIINLVTDPDQNPRVLDAIERLLRSYRGPVVNRPAAVLLSRRDKVARQLASLPNLHVPKVLRLRRLRPTAVREMIARASFTFPAILRAAGTHTGRIVGRFDSFEAMESHLDGSGTHFLTEYVEFRSPDGLYRKYRVFFAGQRMVLRHLLVDEKWSIHSDARLGFMVHRPDLIEEERRLFREEGGAFSEPVRDALRSVRDRLPLDFFGIDFGITSAGKPLLFEANATMNALPVMRPEVFPHVIGAIEAIRHGAGALVGAEPAESAPPAPALEAAQ